MPSRTHSEMVYWNRHKDELYRIYTDYSYGKQYMVLDVKLHETPKVENLENKDDVNFNTLQEQIRKIQSELEVLNGKYNVKTDAESSTESSTDTAGK
jgi:TolA-binding protein